MEPPNQDSPAAKPDDLHDPPLNDLRIRVLMIPLFGIGIPHLTGLFGSIGPAAAAYWAGLAWFNVLSFLIWQGNRFFLIQQRRHFDWFRHPMRKVTLLVFANVFYTAPLTVAMLYGWFRFAGFGPDWSVIRTVTLVNVICVIFITHVYETVYLIRQREGDLLAFEKSQRARAEAELEALKAQIDPHFLFNCLNTLSCLIQNDPPRALRFNENLADVCRYILRNKSRELVTLEEELEFLERYYGLLKLRFEDAVALELPAPGGALDRHLIPPISLQLLLDNAVKHNEFSRREPLRVQIVLGEDFLLVENEKRKRASVRHTARVGLKNLDERCRLILGRGIEVMDDDRRFAVRMPMRKAA